jgi:hypothetical protein
MPRSRSSSPCVGYQPQNCTKQGKFLKCQYAIGPKRQFCRKISKKQLEHRKRNISLKVVSQFRKNVQATHLERKLNKLSQNRSKRIISNVISQRRKSKEAKARQQEIQNHKYVSKRRLIWREDVFSKTDLNSLLRTKLDIGRKRRGQTSFSLLDICNIAEEGSPKGNASIFIVTESGGVTPRERNTRWDIKLTDTWAEKMRETNNAMRTAHDVATNVRTMDTRCKNAKIDWHVTIVHPESPDQDVHIDDIERRGSRCYYTLIVPLTSDSRAGGTYFPDLNRTFTYYGGYVLFDGAIEHFGIGNKSNKDRVFIYAAIYTGADKN